MRDVRLPGDLDHDEQADFIRSAIEQNGAATVYCDQCSSFVGVDRSGLACDHSRLDAPPLDSPAFDDVFDDGIVTRARLWIKRTLQKEKVNL